MDTESFDHESDRIKLEISKIERRLFEKSKAFARQFMNRNVDIQDFLGKLPSNTSVVEYITIIDCPDVREDEVPISERDPLLRTFAFVVTPQHKINLVDLGATTVLDELVRSSRTAIDSELAMFNCENPQINPALRAETAVALRKLYQAVWAPVEQLLDHPKQIFISPDEQLNLAPFAALIDNEGRFLIEKYPLAYLTSGKEVAAETKRQDMSEIEFLAVANVKYASKSNGLPNFEMLPDTKLEIESIIPLIRGRRGHKVLTGYSATKRALHKAKKPRILHLATHGYFLQNEPSDLGETEASQNSRRDPLLLSGLVFSRGRGKSPSMLSKNEGDAYLTALEVSGMNFSTCDLVVLSACHTGVGLPRLGEGVFGLRRAFSLAGARNLVMSLWAISDEDAPNQMIAFYRNLHKQSPADALRNAQFSTIGLLTEELGYAPVGLWAPFFVQGASAFEPLYNPAH
ncbi:MAG: CHAT domain-containing protein [Nitrospiraceae bacterium]